jgi:hypothetical protein
MAYPDSAYWFLAHEHIDTKRLMAYMYFLHAWSCALIDDYDDELEFRVTPNGITESQIKKDFVLNEFEYPTEQPSVKNKWLYDSIIETYNNFKTDELYEIIKNDEPYQWAKKRKKLKNIITNNDLQKYYRFLYRNSR